MKYCAIALALLFLQTDVQDVVLHTNGLLVDGGISLDVFNNSKRQEYYTLGIEGKVGRGVHEWIVLNNNIDDIGQVGILPCRVIKANSKQKVVFNVTRKLNKRFPNDSLRVSGDSLSLRITFTECGNSKKYLSNVFKIKI